MKKKQNRSLVENAVTVIAFPYHCNTLMKFRHFIDCYQFQYPKFSNSELVFKLGKQWSLILQNEFRKTTAHFLTFWDLMERCELQESIKLK